MKTILTLTFLILSQSAFAFEATLNAVQVDASRFAFAIETAKVSINEESGIAQLIIRYKNPCPSQGTGVITCRALRPSDETITLPLITKEEGACGATIYTAQRPNRSFGGVVETLVITDLSTLVCRMKINPNEMTQVQYGLAQKIGQGQASQLSPEQSSSHPEQSEGPLRPMENESIFVGQALTATVE